MIFLKEHASRTCTAHVFKREEDFVVVCYNLGEESLSDPFETEELANDYALAFCADTLEAGAEEQQTTVIRGCCD